MASVQAVHYERQDGSISTTWRVRWREPGNPKLITKSFKRNTAATKHARQIERLLATGEYINPRNNRTTLTHYITDTWWPTKSLKPKTVDSYRGILKLEIIPRFGDTPIGDISGADIETWLGDMTRDHKSGSRIRQSKTLLHQILGHAARHRHIRYNPADGIRASVTTIKKLPRFITANEIDIIAAHVPARYRALVQTLGYCGLRWAEVVGLQRRDINLLKRRLHIRRTLSEVNGTFHDVPPKTWAERDVVLPGFLVETLRVHLNEHVSAEPEALVFTQPDGGPIRNSNFRRRVWRPAVEAAAIEPLTMHEMRHTAASIMAEAGWSLQAAKEQLGHSSILITADVYSHLFDTSREELADRLDEVHRAAQT